MACRQRMRTQAFLHYLLVEWGPDILYKSTRVQRTILPHMNLMLRIGHDFMFIPELLLRVRLGAYCVYLLVFTIALLLLGFWVLGLLFVTSWCCISSLCHNLFHSLIRCSLYCMLFMYIGLLY